MTTNREYADVAMNSLGRGEPQKKQTVVADASGKIFTPRAEARPYRTYVTLATGKMET